MSSSSWNLLWPWIFHFIFLLKVVDVCFGLDLTNGEEKSIGHRSWKMCGKIIYYNSPFFASFLIIGSVILPCLWLSDSHCLPVL